MHHNHHIFSEVEIEEAQVRFARTYRLSRQEALVLALLVRLPTVTATTLKAKIGAVQHHNLVGRLRKRLKEADDKVTIHTMNGFGYCLDEGTRLRLAGRQPPVVQRPIHPATRGVRV